MKKTITRHTELDPEAQIDHILALMDITGDFFFEDVSAARDYHRNNTSPYNITITVEKLGHFRKTFACKKGE